MAQFPVTPSEIESTIPESTGSICSKLEALWSLSNKMATAFGFMVNEDRTLTNDFLSMIMPPGAMMLWPLASNIPSGWVAANGQLLSVATYPTLAAMYGVNFGGDGTNTFGVPDMGDKFPIGASGTKAVGSNGGSATVSLVADNIPPLTPDYDDGVDAIIISEASTAGTATTLTGGGTAGRRLPPADLFKIGNQNTDGPTPVATLNPYKALIFIVRT